MPRKDPEAYKAYMREYMRNRSKSKKKEPKQEQEKMSQDDFNVAEAVLPQEGKEVLDLNGKAAKTLLDTAKKASKDKDTDEEDPVFKMIEKGMKYLPIIMEAVKGFNSAAGNFQATQRQAQPQRPSIQPPSGWESMSPLQRMSKKYSAPEWYAAGERWEDYKQSGGAVAPEQYVTPVNTNYVDPTYNQAVAQREAKSLAELKNKYPEPPVASDSVPQAAPQEPKEKPEFVKQVQEKRGGKSDADSSNNDSNTKTETSPEQTETEAQTMLINAMREDNNKYIEMAFNYLGGLSMEQFKDYVENIDKFKPKLGMLKMFLPVQTKEMLKATTDAEFVQIFKEKCPDKHTWLKENKKIPELKKLFQELKEGL